MNTDLQLILQQLQAEKSMSRESLLEAVRSAIESAARKTLNAAADITVEVDPQTLKPRIFEIRSVVDTIEDETRDLLLEEARALNPNVNVGDRLKVPTEPKDFGRIAAQTAKQVIIQKIKDAERESIYDEYKSREGELITGIVKRITHGNIVVTIGRGEAIVPHREQSPRENFKPGDRIRAFLLEVEKSPRGPQIVLSRACPEMVRCLFELEVPEIYDSTVEIKGIAREAGSRTKIAVMSNDSNVDPVGACVGMKGARVRSVVEELSGEKIDIVRWSEDPVELCANALNPADILDITADNDNKMILVVVPHDQLSLAIGKRGQNARLASRLMGWTIDIKSDVELTDESGFYDEIAGERGDEEERAAAPAKKSAAPEAVEAATSSAPPETGEEANAVPTQIVQDDTPDGEAEPDAEEPSSDSPDLTPQEAGPEGESDQPQE